MRAYLLVMAVAAIVTFLSTGVVRGLASRWGVVAQVRDRDVHVVPVPRLGGVAIFLGVAGGLGLAWTIPFLSGVYGRGTTGPLGILLAATVICVVGVVDDVWGLDAWTKLAGQALAGVVMALLGVRLLALPVNGLTLLSGWMLVVLTVVVVLVTANAVNFVDGLDGLAAGIVAISGTAFFAYSYQISREASPDDYSSTATLIAAVTVGAAVGFLPHNLHPARIFMGDSGALTLGLLLAAATISVTGDTDPRVLEETGLAPAFVPLLLPAAALVVPVLDVVMAVVRRTLAGRSPFSPDRKHLHHRMLALGHSHRWAVALMHAWVALLSFGAAATAFWPWGTVARVGGVAAALLLLLTVVPRVVEAARPGPGRSGGPGRPSDEATGAGEADGTGDSGGPARTATLPGPAPGATPTAGPSDTRDPVPAAGGPGRREGTG
ncbi:MAG: MraY family glycosyltransferase [Kineosporiaceae bacterium]